MSLFLVRHQHAPERCPATDPEMGAMLLNHLSRPNVTQHGVEIRGEAVIDGEHTLVMIVESADERAVLEFMRPFAMAGSVEVHPASTCVAVVARGGCAGTVGAPADAAPAMDPEEACHRAIEAGLVVHRAQPLNCETSIPALIGGVVMPNAHFYVRNHFDIPMLEPATWSLTVGGLVDRPLELSLRDLRGMPSQTLFVTLECAGNGRSLLTPPVEGEQWNLGAVSTAEWTGVPLVEVLDRAGVRAGAREAVFRGADGGAVPGRSEAIRFERSLGIDDARDSEVLLAYAMNGEPLPAQHGYPLRVIVPGWYAVASVKWLTEIELVDSAFEGHYQAEKYVYEWDADAETAREPVTLQHVRSLITEPQPDELVRSGDVPIRGVAWSGSAPIAHVEVSVGGAPWQHAQLLGERKRHSWQWWELITSLEQPGPTTIRSRATDLAGRTQPEAPIWNRQGYGNNSIGELRVEVG
ncbi:MAG TPA: sulfite oxidase [Thermoleophilaceae bacterium]|nr:sulfite oxidase [Thermoleophilaceae bacterium]